MLKVDVLRRCKLHHRQYDKSILAMVELLYVVDCDAGIQVLVLVYMVRRLSQAAFARTLRSTPHAPRTAPATCALLHCIACSPHYCSLPREIRLAIKNQANIWAAIVTPTEREGEREEDRQSLTFVDEVLYDTIQSHEGSINIALLASFIAWTPIVFVFLIDAQIMFSFVQTILGIGAGLHLRVGQGNTWQSLEHNLVKRVAASYSKKLDTTPHNIQRPPTSQNAAQSDANVVEYLPSDTSTELSVTLLGQGPAHDDVERSEEQSGSDLHLHRHFVEAWNTFMQKLNDGDYISKHEQEIYTFMKFRRSDSLRLLHNAQLSSIWAPPLQYLGSLGQLLDIVTESETSFRISFFGKRKDDGQDGSEKKWFEHATHLVEILGSSEENSDCLEALSVSVDLCGFLIGAILTSRSENDSDFDRDVLQWLHKTYTRLRGGKNRHSINHQKKRLGPILRSLLKNPTDQTGAKAQRLGLLNCAATFAHCIQKCSDRKNTTACASAYVLQDKAKQSFKEALKELQSAVKIDRDQVGLIKGMSLDEKGLVKCRQTLAKAVQTAEDDLAKEPSNEDLAHAVDAINLAYLIIMMHQILRYIQLFCEGRDDDDLPAGTVETVIQNSPFLSLDVSDDVSIRSAVSDKLVHDDNIPQAAQYLYHVLKTRRGTAQPKSPEARRRILTFVSSLYMEMPDPKPVNAAPAMCTLTPHCKYTRRLRALYSLRVSC
eukprot:COSAG01_NODE_7479_length_3193_cov_1.911441_1_plen_715_part_00